MLKIKNFSTHCLVLNLIGLFFSAHICAANKTDAIPPPIVETVTVQSSSISDQITATGTAIAIPGIIAKAEIAGRVTNIFFKPGSNVIAGAPLIEIFPDIIKAQYSQYQAEQRLTQLNFERYTKLYRTHTISKADYDKAKADLESTQARLEQSQATLKQTIVRAPFTGRLGINLVSLGQYINVGQDIVSLQALNPIYVDFSIPEIFANKIAVNQSIIVHSDIYPHEEFHGKVYAIDPLVNQKTRSLSVRAMVPNQDEKILPGTFAEVIVITSNPQQVIKIPQTAIVYDPKGNYVYKVIDNKAMKTLVTLGARDNENIIVQSGLNTGDTIVTAGQLKIAQDNTPVIRANTTQTSQ